MAISICIYQIYQSICHQSVNLYKPHTHVTPSSQQRVFCDQLLTQVCGCHYRLYPGEWRHHSQASQFGGLDLLSSLSFPGIRGLSSSKLARSGGLSMRSLGEVDDGMPDSTGVTIRLRFAEWMLSHGAFPKLSKYQNSWLLRWFLTWSDCLGWWANAKQPKNCTGKHS